MKSTVTALAAAVAITLGTSAINAQQQTTTPQRNPQVPKNSPSEVTLTGCVIQGSSPTVFILDNAKKYNENSNRDVASQNNTKNDAKGMMGKGVQYVLTSSAQIDLRTHLNHEVRIVGEMDKKVTSTTPAMPPTTAPPTTVPADPQMPTDEKKLARLSAKSLTMISDTCTTSR